MPRSAGRPEAHRASGHRAVTIGTVTPASIILTLSPVHGDAELAEGFDDPLLQNVLRDASIA